MSNPKITLIVGESASGKSTIIDKICEKYGLKSIQSYTTRKQRCEGEQGHIFVNKEDYVFFDDGITHIMKIFDIDNNKFEEIDIVAYTYFNGNHYWADMQQVQSSNFYVIDRDGVNYFKSKVGDEVDFQVIYIKAPLFRRIYRILKRDGFKKGISRLINDFKMFRGLEYDYKIVNKDLDKSIEEVYTLTKEFEYV